MHPHALFRVWTGLASAAALALAAGNATADGWTRFGGLPEGCNGAVRAMARLGDGRIVLGGDFSLCGSAAANGVAVWDPALPGFTTLGRGRSNGVSGFVHALAVDGDSVWVGGRFEKAGGLLANHIARWDAAADTWHTIMSGGITGVDASATVLAIAVDGPHLYVGGRFVRGAGLPARGLARWHRERNEWSLLAPGVTDVFSDQVLALRVHDRHLYIGGNFRPADARMRGIARWSLDEEAWRPIRGGSLSSGSWVSDLIHHQGSLYAAGVFSAIGGGSMSNVARLDLITERWAPIGVPGAEGIDGEARALAIVGNDLVVGGFFASAGSGTVPSRNLARFRLDAGVWAPTAYGAPDHLRALLAVDGRVLVGGDFREAGGRPLRHLADWRPLDEDWAPVRQVGGRGLDGIVQAVAADSGGLYVAGNLWTSDGTSRRSILAWHEPGQDWRPVGADPELPGQLGRAVAISGGNVYLGGDISIIGQGAGPGIAVWLRDQGRWGTVGGGVHQAPNERGTVLSLAPTPGGVIAGGEFRLVGGQAAANLAHFENGLWRPLSIAPADTWQDAALALADGGDEVFVGGRFAAAGPIPASRIARWRRATGVWSTLGAAPNEGVDGSVTAIAVAGPWVYVAGSFTSAGGLSVPGIARWHRPTGAWHPMGAADAVGLLPQAVSAIAVIGEQVYVGGRTADEDGLLRGRITRWDARTETWHRLDHDEIDGPVRRFAARGDTLWLVGGFRSVGGGVSSGIAAWTLDARAADRLLGDGFEDLP